MINPEQINIAYSIFRQLNPKLHESIQKYDGNNEPRFGHFFQYQKNTSEILAVWSDFKTLNQWQLSILFKRRTEINQEFFLIGHPTFYRIGWRVPK